jgi:lipid-A-disaccharide synthase
MSESKRVFVSAGEHSGNVYVASVIKDLLGRYPELEFEGVGGTELGDCGVKILHNSDQWGSIGLVEALKRWKLVLVNHALCTYLEEERPDLVLLADYPGFNMPLARKARSLGIPSVYLFPPRKFSRDSNSVKDAASNITRVAAEFEPTFETYRQAGARVDFVGHPMLDILPQLSREDLRAKYSIQSNERVILLMPGSRVQELVLLLPLFRDLSIRLFNKVPSIRFHLLGAQNLRSNSKMNSELERFEHEQRELGVPVSLFWENRFEHMCISDFAVATSGTATLELACYKVPMAICYKVTPLTAFLAKLFSRIPRFIGLPNLLANDSIVPEFVQQHASVDEMAPFIEECLLSAEKLESIRSKLGVTISKLGGTGAIQRVNRLILEELGIFESSEKGPAPLSNDVGEKHQKESALT